MRKNIISFHIVSCSVFATPHDRLDIELGISLSLSLSYASVRISPPPEHYALLLNMHWILHNA